MGGFPAFVAFTLVFFRIRTRAGMENGGMQQELSDRQITGRLLWKYAAGYLVLWGILRIAFLISRVTGWGNINGASAVEYVRQINKKDSSIWMNPFSMQEMGLEPTRYCSHRHLKPARLPIPPLLRTNAIL